MRFAPQSGVALHRIKSLWRQIIRIIVLAIFSAGLPNPCLGATVNPAFEIYSRPHRLVDIGGRRLNLFCSGHGAPTIVLDGGLGDDMTEWRAVQTKLAGITKVCSYDRAGLGFSDPGPEPRTASALSDDLEQLLKRAGVHPPYVMVGSSLASLHIQLFTDRHLQQVSGMVLVDPSFEHQVAVYEAATPAYIPSAQKQVATLQSCISQFRKETPAPGTALYKDCIGDPDPDLPPDVVSALVAHTTSDSFRMVASELKEFSGASSDEVDASRRPYGDMPLIVLTAGNPGGSDPDTLIRSAIWTRMHDRMASLSSRGTNRIVKGATHHIQLSKPEAVIDAVSDVIAQARARHVQELAHPENH